MTGKPEDRIEVVQDDITKLDVDAIVNAANSQLKRGGGVDGAIHRAAGPELQKACNEIGGCPTGEAVVTSGFNLPAHHIIHTVGPVWGGGGKGEDEALASAYRNSLRRAEEQGARSVAFPAISTGVYGYPVERATDIAVRTVCDWLQDHDLPERVFFCAFDAATKEAYERALAG
jgi:O-acetyl-ADP-ribose deacetylase (regulator of RNase III)